MGLCMGCSHTDVDMSFAVVSGSQSAADNMPGKMDTILKINKRLYAVSYFYSFNSCIDYELQLVYHFGTLP